MQLSQIRFNRDFVAGLLLGIPIAYPSVPFYWFAMISAAVLIRLRAKRLPREFLVVLSIVLGLGMLSNIAAPRPELIGFSRSLLSVLTLGLFVYGVFVDDIRKFLRGYLLPTNLLALAVPVMFILSGIFLKGAMVFVVPSFRLWGAAYFPDWPNFLALTFCLGFLIQLFLIKNPFWAMMNLVAATLTTSRMVFVAVALAIAVWVLRSPIRVVYAGALFFAMIVGMEVVAPVDGSTVNLAERLTRTADREAIYGVAAGLIESQPVLGFGSVLFDRQLAHIVHESFHSFYLDLLVRFGLPVLLLFSLLLLSFDWRVAARSKAFLSVALLIVVGSFLQNYLRHPHFFLFYSAWVLNLHKIVQIESGDVGRG